MRACPLRRPTFTNTRSPLSLRRCDARAVAPPTRRVYGHAVATQPQPATRPFPAQLTDLAPGVILSASVAVVAYLAAPYVGRYVPIPAMVLALVIGIALNPIAGGALVRPGMAFCVRTVLRWAVALLGLRVALSDIEALGLSTGVMIVIAMMVTLLSGFLFARLSGRSAGFGALVGAATAVCGASATLAMIVYPPLCILLGFDAQATGVMLGGTIHDVAQVVGAGYAVSDTAGNTAVIVKLFRVFLLLPVVLGIGWYFTKRGVEHGAARVPVPGFALVFLALCFINSAMLLAPQASFAFVPVKHGLVEASTWGLLIAIGALGLDTSVSAIVSLGWRHVATVVASTAVMFALVTGFLLAQKFI